MGVSNEILGAFKGYSLGILMFTTKIPPSKGESCGPSIRALQESSASSVGKMWMPAPAPLDDVPHTSWTPSLTFFNSIINLLTEAGGRLPMASWEASPATVAESDFTVFEASSAARPAERFTWLDFVNIFSWRLSSATRSRGLKAGFSAPLRRACRETTLSASNSSKPSPKSLICQHSPPLALTIFRRLESGRSPTMMASTIAPIEFAA
mmetsp:Transcript_13476/g.20474  ORF Transcript_13476/g.20474 Transcript_13476/m.20474 type:complete len:209 (-) Transcript_13476:102-728(-)